MLIGKEIFLANPKMVTNVNETAENKIITNNTNTNTK